jgi:hypothetical protein
MTVKPQSKGRCQSCDALMVKGQMTRHLARCAYPEKGATVRVIQLRAANGPYWIDLDVKADAQLGELDEFLRAIWLECCGHLSAFTIGATEYSVMPEDDPWGPRNRQRSMEITAGKALPKEGATFVYEYDFGSTTELKLKVGAALQAPKRSDAVRLLARNEPPALECEACDAPAAFACGFCSHLEDTGLVCAAHVDDHHCGEEGMLPAVNSPRMGVCAYTGEVE